MVSSGCWMTPWRLFYNIVHNIYTYNIIIFNNPSVIFIEKKFFLLILSSDLMTCKFSIIIIFGTYLVLTINRRIHIIHLLFHNRYLQMHTG